MTTGSGQQGDPCTPLVGANVSGKEGPIGKDAWGDFSLNETCPWGRTAYTNRNQTALQQLLWAVLTQMVERPFRA